MKIVKLKYEKYFITRSGFFTQHKWDLLAQVMFWRVPDRNKKSFRRTFRLFAVFRIDGQKYSGSHQKRKSL